MELGVRLALFPDQKQLGAEAEEGEGAVEGRQLVGAREILAFFGPQGEIGPVGLVEAAGDGGRGSHAETQGQRVGSREATPGSRETMRAQAGLLFAIAAGQAEGERRGGLPASGQREIPAGTVQVFGLLVSPLVPACPFDRHPLRKWFLAICLIMNAKKSLSNLQSGRDLKLPSNTGCFLGTRIRRAIQKDPAQKELFRGIVEMDETYVGGKPKEEQQKRR